MKMKFQLSRKYILRTPQNLSPELVSFILNDCHQFQHIARYKFSLKFKKKKRSFSITMTEEFQNMNQFVVLPSEDEKNSVTNLLM
jgi:hypothetical protein